MTNGTKEASARVYAVAVAERMGLPDDALRRLARGTPVGGEEVRYAALGEAMADGVPVAVDDPEIAAAMREVALIVQPARD